MNKTHLVVLLDRSGSMESLRLDMENGFNNYVEEQKKVEGVCNLTLVQFDSMSIDTVCDRLPLGSVPLLSLKPRGGTPLLDAIGETITRLSAFVEDNEKTLVIIITDGYENASAKWNRGSIKSLIETRQLAGWEFIYLGANQDAFAEALNYGIKADYAATYVGNALGTQAAWSSVSTSSVKYRSGLTATIEPEDRAKLAKQLEDEEK